jgi:HTH-type transcriptional regulator, sugar sensing transcriptional regulator
MSMDRGNNLQLTASMRRLGFNDLEAEIYIDLLKNPQSTGYKIGKSLRKPHANVYQGLVALEKKGAVTLESGANRAYSAVPPPELLEQLRRRIDQDLRSAGRALKRLAIADQPEDERFYHLTSAEQVYARARTMLAQVSETLVVEAGPAPAKEIRSALQDVVERGVSTGGLVMSKEDLIAGAKLSVARSAADIQARWRGDQLVLIADATEFLVAQFERGSDLVRGAVWARSEVLGVILNNGVISNVILHSLAISKKMGSPEEYLLGRLPKALQRLVGAGEDEHG